jgi:hypothetical protein
MSISNPSNIASAIKVGSIASKALQKTIPSPKQEYEEIGLP